VLEDTVGSEGSRRRRASSTHSDVSDGSKARYTHRPRMISTGGLSEDPDDEAPRTEMTYTEYSDCRDSIILPKTELTGVYEGMDDLLPPRLPISKHCAGNEHDSDTWRRPTGAKVSGGLLAGPISLQGMHSPHRGSDKAAAGVSRTPKAQQPEDCWLAGTKSLASQLELLEPRARSPSSRPASQEGITKRPQSRDLANAVSILGGECDVRSKDQSEMLADILQLLPFFRQLGRQLTVGLAGRAVLTKLKHDAVLAAAGAPIDCFYMVLAGSLTIFKGNHQTAPNMVGTIKKGEGFFQTGLVSEIISPVSVVGTHQSWLLTISAVEYRSIRSQQRLKRAIHHQAAEAAGMAQDNQRITQFDILTTPPEERNEEMNRFFSDLTKHLDFLKSMPSGTKWRLATQMQFAMFPIGHEVFREGDKGDLFYVILSGSVDVLKDVPGFHVSKVVASMAPGAAFGELALLRQDGVRAGTVRCATDCQFLTLSRAAYQAELAAEHTEELHRKMRFLSHVFPALRHFTHQHLSTFTTYFASKILPAETVLAQKGDNITDVYFVVRGEVKLTVEVEMFKPKSVKSSEIGGDGALKFIVDKFMKSKRALLVGSASKGECFGEMHVWAGCQKWLCTATTSSDTELLHINTTHFLKYITPDIVAALRTNAVVKSENMRARVASQLNMLLRRGWEKREEVPLPVVPPVKKRERQDKIWKKREALRRKRLGLPPESSDEEPDVPKVDDTEQWLEKVRKANPTMPKNLLPEKNEVVRDFGFYFRPRVPVNERKRDTKNKMEIWAAEGKKRQMAQKDLASLNVSKRVAAKVDQYRQDTDNMKSLKERLERYEAERHKVLQNERDFKTENAILAREYLSPDHRHAIAERVVEKTHHSVEVLTRHQKFLEAQRQAAAELVKKVEQTAEQALAIKEAERKRAIAEWQERERRYQELRLMALATPPRSPEERIEERREQIQQHKYDARMRRKEKARHRRAVTSLAITTRAATPPKPKPPLGLQKLQPRSVTTPRPMYKSPRSAGIVPKRKFTPPVFPPATPDSPPAITNRSALSPSHKNSVSPSNKTMGSPTNKSSQLLANRPASQQRGLLGSPETARRAASEEPITPSSRKALFQRSAR